MIYIPHIKKRIEELAPRWHKGELTRKELFEFYDLLNDVIREGREDRSWIVWKPDPKADPPIHTGLTPETFLVELFRPRIKNVVAQLFKYSEYFKDEREIEDDKPFIKDKSSFRVWCGNAEEMVKTIILGDATTRVDRREQVQSYLKSNGKVGKGNLRDKVFIETEHLFVNSKKLHSNTKEALESWRHKEEDYEYLPWAEQCALNDGVGYNPTCRRDKLKDLISKLRDCEDFIKSWEDGSFRDKLKTRTNMEEYLKSKDGYTGALPSEIRKELKSCAVKRPNLVNFLFGEIASKGELFRRLGGLKKFMNNREKIERVADSPMSCRKKGHNEEIDNEELADASSYHAWHENNNETDNDFMEGCDPDIKIDIELERRGLTKKQREVFMMKIKGMSSVEISDELKIVKRAVDKRLKNIKDPKIKEILKNLPKK